MKILIFLFAISSSTSALIFNCTFSYTSFSPINSKYTCTTTPYDFEKNQKIEAINGVDTIGRNSSHVEGFYVKNCAHLFYFPQGISNFFPNLIALTLYQCGLTTLTGRELEELPMLEYFNAYNNKIVRIPGHLFKPTLRMRYISFESNQVKHVGENLLERLLFLEYVYFSYNPCYNNYNTATSVSSLTDVIGKLRLYCPDNTTILENSNEKPMGCTITEQNKVLELMNSEMSLRIEEMSLKLDEVSKQNAVISEMLEKVLASVS